MDVQVAESGPCRRTLTIKIPADQVKKHLDQMFQAAAKQVDLKGFRKGKVPRAVLEKKYGADIQREAKQQLVQRSVSDACREHQLTTVGRAELVGIGEEPLGNAPIEFQVHLDIRPKFELKDVTGIEIRAQNSDVTDEDMERALNDLAAQKRTLGPVDDAVGENDFAKVDMRFKSAAGTEVSTRNAVQLNPGIPIAGTDPETFKAQLVGATAGCELTFELTFPDTFADATVRGQTGTVEVKVHEVLRVQDATLDDEFAKAYEFETIDALREELQKRIGEQKVATEKTRQVDAILEIIANDHQFDLPQSLVDDEIKHGLTQFESRMKEGGIAEAEIKVKLEEAQEPARQDSERRVHMFFLIEAIAKKHEISINENDVEVELQRIAAQNNASVDDVRAHFQSEQQQARQLQLAILEGKVRDFLRENAQITDN